MKTLFQLVYTEMIPLVSNNLSDQIFGIVESDTYSAVRYDVIRKLGTELWYSIENELQFKISENY